MSTDEGRFGYVTPTAVQALPVSGLTRLRQTLTSIDDVVLLHITGGGQKGQPYRGTRKRKRRCPVFARSILGELKV